MVVFHSCRPRPFRLRWGFEGTTLEEAWQRSWEGFAAESGPAAPLFNPDEERMRAETDRRDGYHHE